MQLPPLMLSEVSLLFAIGAIILLITTELSSPYYGLTQFIIDRRKLKNTTFTVSAILLTITATGIISRVFTF